VAEHGDIAPALLRDLQVIARTERDRKLGVVCASGDAAVNLPASTRLVSGARLVKVYQGVTHVVTVEDGGFVWADQSYASLSAIAKAITGTHWNGLLFFGLRTRRVKPRHDRPTSATKPAGQLTPKRTRRHA
jgi:hypothetical protein